VRCEVFHQRLDRRDEVWVGWIHVLELFELFFDLVQQSAIYKR
jgi:hypothetical protein